MTHVGLALLMVAFLLLSNGGSGLFSDLRITSENLPATVRNTIFFLAFLGFGSKAGIVPLHVWLPKAHPAAPSHVSALMSGVMIKLGVYGILRVMLDLLGGGSILVGRFGTGCWCGIRPAGYIICIDGNRLKTVIGLFLRRKYWNYSNGHWSRADLSQLWIDESGRAGIYRRAFSYHQSCCL